MSIIAVFPLSKPVTFYTDFFCQSLNDQPATQGSISGSSLRTITASHLTRRLPGTLQHEEQPGSLNINGPSSDQNPENLHIGLSLTPDIVSFFCLLFLCVHVA